MRGAAYIDLMYAALRTIQQTAQTRRQHCYGRRMATPPTALLRAIRRSRPFLPVDLTAMAYIEDSYFLTFVVDSIQNSIVADSDPPSALELASQ